MEMIQGRHGTFEVLAGDRIVSESLRWYGEWAENELDILRRFLVDGNAVADIGAFIGTHSVAFARAVGANGVVHSFEPRPEVHAVLARNITRNALKQVVLYQVGISDAAGTITVAAFDPDAVANPGGLELRAADFGVSASIITLDSLALDRLDLIKIDVEGMEARVLRGANSTIASLRPVIFAECNTMEGASEVISGFDHPAYSVFGASYAAFNAANFRGNDGNIFGENRECALIFVPDERLDGVDVQDLWPITSLDDVVGLLMHKPQYLPEILPHMGAAAVRDEGSRTSHTELSPGVVSARPLHVVVPFFRNEHLVGVIGRSLTECSDELMTLGAQVFLFNDSPDYPGLGIALDSLADSWPSDNLTIVTNETNKGFVSTCNLAFEHALRAGADVVLLNSDTAPFPGAIREMVAVSRLDPMIGFVSPRSNNATLASLPPEAVDTYVPSDRAYADFVALSPRLERYSLVPTAVGFALWIKHEVLSELGGFDPVYGRGYNEENDLIMRANRCGYRAALANHAFVWHEGEASLSATAGNRSRAEQINGLILSERYPEYPRLISRHMQSSAHRAELLVSQLYQPDNGRLVAFDFSNFGPFHNGTFESGIKLIKAARRLWPKDIRVGALMSEKAWRYHGLQGETNIQRLDPEGEELCAAIVRIGQPFQDTDLDRMYRRAAVVGVFMLDTISADCGYLSLDFDDSVWKFVFDESDVIFTNSEFTLDRIQQRYRIGPDVKAVVSRHSLDPADYAPRNQPRTESGAKHVFVVGNHYAHKFVRPTVDAIVAAHPDLQIVAVGYPSDPPPPRQVRAYAAGQIDDATFETFYSSASIVVFPSHYEGFGFPVLHALARRKPVLVRDSQLNRELASRIAASANIHFYESTASLVALLESPPMWIDALRDVHPHNWDNSAVEVWHALRQAMDDAGGARIARRIDQLSRRISHTTLTEGYLLAVRTAPLFDRILKLAGARRVLHTLASIRRRIRKK